MDGYAAAVKLYIEAYQRAKDPDNRRRLAEKCRIALEKAENIKAFTSGEAPRPMNLKQPDSSAIVPPGPKQNQNLSTHEQIILLKGSKLNGYTFPPWTRPPDPHEFELIDGDEGFV
jgi:calpain-7